MTFKILKQNFSDIFISENDHKSRSSDKINSGSKSSMPSIISRNLKINGELQSSGIIEVEGYITGNIKAQCVIIRESGVIEGEIAAENVSVKGGFIGNIKARNVNVSSKAKINGNIEYSSLCVEDGACIEGQFKQIVQQQNSKINNLINDS